MTARPIFVVGAPRTGTTLTRDILNGHPSVYLFNEVHFFEIVWDARERIGDLRSPESVGRAFDRLCEWVRTVGEDRALTDFLTAEELARRAEAEGGGYRGLMLAFFRARAEMAGAERWGDSSPQDVLYVAQILDWFPGARIVGVVRDPRGFLSSYKNQWRREVKRYRERYNPITNSVLWRSYMRALLRAKGSTRGGAVHIVRYEDLVREPETETRKVCAHVGVEYDPAMIGVERSNTSFETAESALQQRGIHTGSLERWRTELTPTEVWVGERVFGGVMGELGYERAAAGAFPPSAAEFLRISSKIPGRLLNMLFGGSGKPLTVAKIRRVLSSFRSS